MEGGATFNVFPDTCKMQGTIRSFNTESRDKVKQRITEICEGTALAFGCKVDVDLWDQYPAVINHKCGADHVERLARTHFGDAHFSKLDLPLMASEDFSYFLHHAPGAFFALGTLKPGRTPKTLHTSDYDFNDDMVATGGLFWCRLVEDRLSVKVLG